MKRKKKGLWLHPPKRVKLSKDQNESTESRDSTTTNTQTTTPVNPPNYRFSIYNSPWSSARKRKRRKQLFSKSGEEQLVDEITLIIPSVLKTLEKAGLREDFCLLLKFLFLVTAAILNGVRGCWTHFERDPPRDHPYLVWFNLV